VVVKRAVGVSRRVEEKELFHKGTSLMVCAQGQTYCVPSLPYLWMSARESLFPPYFIREILSMNFASLAIW